MKLRKDRKWAEGEVTGHAHRCVADDCEVYDLPEEGEDRRSLGAPSGTDVTHEEHETISLPPGKYDIRRQREIDPDTEDVRVVAD